MNYPMKYISSHLRTRVRRLSNSFQVLEEAASPWVFDDAAWFERISHYYLPDQVSADHPIFISAGENPASSGGRDVPKKQLLYSMIRTENAAWLIGPCLFAEPLRFLHYLPVQEEEDEAQVPRPQPQVDLFPCALIELAELSLLLYYDARGNAESTLTPSEVVALNILEDMHAANIWKNYNHLLIRNMEHGIVHNPYNQEIREYAALEMGNVEELQRIVAEDYYARQGLLSTDPVRQELDMGIVIITLSRSAAARGGVSPEACYSLSDASIQEMEACKDPAVIRSIARSTQLRYANLVREQKASLQAKDSASPSSDNRHISHCKDYIFSHLNRKLSVQMIADAIGLEPNYLSTLFHRIEKITLKQYILREKIQLAKNMLAYSPYSYIEIANYLGFSSQSHLGDQFKKLTGMTPRQYRERYGKEDFLFDVVENEVN